MFTWLTLLAAAILIGGAVYVYWDQLKEATKQALATINKVLTSAITVVTYEAGKLISKIVYLITGDNKFIEQTIGDPVQVTDEQAIQYFMAAGLSLEEATERIKKGKEIAIENDIN